MKVLRKQKIKELGENILIYLKQLLLENNEITLNIYFSLHTLMKRVILIYRINYHFLNLLLKFFIFVYISLFLFILHKFSEALFSSNLCIYLMWILIYFIFNSSNIFFKFSINTYKIHFFALKSSDIIACSLAYEST